jgi:hypothetical protein
MDAQLWHRTKALFEAALELEPGQRTAFVEQVCHSDPALRHEVLTLLAVDAEAGGVLDAAALDLLTRLSEPAADAAIDRDGGPGRRSLHGPAD